MGVGSSQDLGLPDEEEVQQPWAPLAAAKLQPSSEVGWGTAAAAPVQSSESSWAAAVAPVQPSSAASWAAAAAPVQPGSVSPALQAMAAVGAVLDSAWQRAPGAWGPPGQVGYAATATSSTFTIHHTCCSLDHQLQYPCAHGVQQGAAAGMSYPGL